LAGAYLGFLAAHDSEVRDICYSAALRRNHYEERLAVTGAAAGELRSGLESWLNGLEEAVSIAKRPKIVFVFPGQGSKWDGMCRKLLAEEPVFRRSIESCGSALPAQDDL
jgi:myxalamid-type polyketide synthase MxaE and MxaD